MLNIPGLVNRILQNMAMHVIILDVCKKETRLMKKRKMNLNKLRKANPDTITRVTILRMTMIHITTLMDMNSR